MDRKRFIAAGGAAAAAAAVPAAALADAGGSADQGLVGSWYGTVTATNPPVGQFNDLISFEESGVVLESRRYAVVTGTPLGTLLETTGHGAWKRTGNRSFEAFFRFLLQSESTTDPIGTDNIHLTLSLAGDSLTGTFVSQVKNLGGNVLLQVEGDYSAERLTV